MSHAFAAVLKNTLHSLHRGSLEYSKHQKGSKIEEKVKIELPCGESYDESVI